MTFIKKTYKTNYLLYFCLFINILIDTIIISLIFWHSLILIKVLIIKGIVLFLHKYKVFHYIFSFITSAFLLYLNYPLGSGGKDLNPGPENPENSENPDKKEGLTTTDCVVIGVCIGIAAVLGGLQVLDHYYPEAIPAIKSAVFAAGITVLASIQKTLQSLSELSASGYEEGGLKKSSLNWESAKANAPSPEAFIAVSHAEAAFRVLKSFQIEPERYYSTLKILHDNNVPSRYLLNKTDWILEINKVCVKNNQVTGDSNPLYALNLSNVDLMFYDTLFSINPSKLKD